MVLPDNAWTAYQRPNHGIGTSIVGQIRFSLALSQLRRLDTNAQEGVIPQVHEHVRRER